MGLDQTAELRVRAEGLENLEAIGEIRAGDPGLGGPDLDPRGQIPRRMVADDLDLDLAKGLVDIREFLDDRRTVLLGLHEDFYLAKLGDSAVVMDF